MKKLILPVLALLLAALCLSACGKAKSSGATLPNGTTPTAAATEASEATEGTEATQATTQPTQPSTTPAATQPTVPPTTQPTVPPTTESTQPTVPGANVEDGDIFIPLG